MKLSFFIIFSIIIFILERVFQLFVVFPVFIFPVFAVLYVLRDENAGRSIPLILVAGLIFDFFSGFSFGIFTLAIFVMCITAFLFKTRFTANAKLFLPAIILSVIFVFEFMMVLSAFSVLRVLLGQMVLILTETAVWSFLLTLLFNKSKFFNQTYTRA